MDIMQLRLVLPGLLIVCGLHQLNAQVPGQAIVPNATFSNGTQGGGENIELFQNEWHVLDNSKPELTALFDVFGADTNSACCGNLLSTPNDYDNHCTGHSIPDNEYGCRIPAAHSFSKEKFQETPVANGNSPPLDIRMAFNMQ